MCYGYGDLYFRPRLLDFVSSLDDAVVQSASQKAFENLPDISKAVSELIVLKGVGPATASAVLAAFAPHLTPFMSDEVNLQFIRSLILIYCYFYYYDINGCTCSAGYGGSSWKLKRLFNEAIFTFCRKIADES